MRKILLALLGLTFCMQSYGQGTFSTAENLTEGNLVSGTVTDNNNGPTNIPFHYYKTLLSGKGIIRIITEINNTSITSAGDVIIRVFFKDQVVWVSKQVTVAASASVIDTFAVTGVEQDSIYILFENYGNVSGGPFNYTTHYNMLNVFPNNETEPNNFHVQAQPLQQGVVLNGHISYKNYNYYLDEYDYFQLILPDNGTADLYYSWTNLSIGTGFNIPAPTVYARGKDSTSYIQLAHSSSPHSDNLTIANNVNTPLATAILDTMHIYGRAKDTIYIHMRNYFSGWGIGYCGAYSLRLEMSDIPVVNEINPNDDLAHAQTITSLDTVKGIIGYLDGVNGMDQDDYYKMATPPGDSVRIYITAINKYRYEPISVNPQVYAYDKNGNALTVFSASGASAISGQLIANIWQQPYDVPVADIMTITNITTDSVYIRISNINAAFMYQFNKTTLTGIDDVSADDAMNIYPNPATDRISISFNVPVKDITEVNLYSLQGKKIAALNFEKQSINSILPLQLPKLDDGVYFISVKTQSGNELQKKIVILNNK
ncbi:MAG: T9SS type A sorting domain-containing protein [Bacteroidota bacterium]